MQIYMDSSGLYEGAWESRELESQADIESMYSHSLRIDHQPMWMTMPAWSIQQEQTTSSQYQLGMSCACSSSNAATTTTTTPCTTAAATLVNASTRIRRRRRRGGGTGGTRGALMRYLSRSATSGVGGSRSYLGTLDNGNSSRDEECGKGYAWPWSWWSGMALPFYLTMPVPSVPSFLPESNSQTNSQTSPQVNRSQSITTSAQDLTLCSCCGRRPVDLYTSLSSRRPMHPSLESASSSSTLSFHTPSYSQQPPQQQLHSQLQRQPQSHLRQHSRGGLTHPIHSDSHSCPFSPSISTTPSSPSPASASLGHVHHHHHQQASSRSPPPSQPSQPPQQPWPQGPPLAAWAEHWAPRLEYPELGATFWKALDRIKQQLHESRQRPWQIMTEYWQWQPWHKESVFGEHEYDLERELLRQQQSDQWTTQSGINLNHALTTQEQAQACPQVHQVHCDYLGADTSPHRHFRVVNPTISTSAAARAPSRGDTGVPRRRERDRGLVESSRSSESGMAREQQLGSDNKAGPHLWRTLNSSASAMNSSTVTPLSSSTFASPSPPPQHLPYGYPEYRIHHCRSMSTAQPRTSSLPSASLQDTPYIIHHHTGNMLVVAPGSISPSHFSLSKAGLTSLSPPRASSDSIPSSPVLSSLTPSVCPSNRRYPGSFTTKIRASMDHTAKDEQNAPPPTTASQNNGHIHPLEFSTLSPTATQTSQLSSSKLSRSIKSRHVMIPLKPKFFVCEDESEDEAEESDVKESESIPNLPQLGLLTETRAMVDPQGDIKHHERAPLRDLNQDGHERKQERPRPRDAMDPSVFGRKLSLHGPPHLSLENHPGMGRRQSLLSDLLMAEKHLQAQRKAFVKSQNRTSALSQVGMADERATGSSSSTTTHKSPSTASSASSASEACLSAFIAPESQISPPLLGNGSISLHPASPPRTNSSPGMRSRQFHYQFPPPSQENDRTQYSGKTPSLQKLGPSLMRSKKSMFRNLDGLAEAAPIFSSRESNRTHCSKMQAVYGDSVTSSASKAV